MHAFRIYLRNGVKDIGRISGGGVLTRFEVSLDQRPLTDIIRSADDILNWVGNGRVDHNRLRIEKLDEDRSISESQFMFSKQASAAVSVIVLVFSGCHSRAAHVPWHKTGPA
jgi:hypothetical protein